MDSDDLPPLLIDTQDLDYSKKNDENILPTPVTIVTGYLGSGKSTLLNYVLRANHGKKIALILNEFGQTSDIERTLAVRNQNADGIPVEQWIELDNGCMCCTAKDAGVSAIEKLMERQGRYDHILIETSGLADPAPIANMFWLDDALMARVKLDGVVTVVDAQTIMRSLDEGPLASLQIACSDVVLVNKCDTVSDTAKQDVINRLLEINGAVKTIECCYGEVPLEQILNLDAYSCLGSSPSLTLTDVHSTVDPHHSHANHNLSTVVIPLTTGQFEDKKGLDDFDTRLHTVLWSKELGGHTFEIHRAKGKLQCFSSSLNDKVTKIVQGVRETYEITDVDYEPEGECKLVLIGKDILPLKQQLIEYFTKIA